MQKEEEQSIRLFVNKMFVYVPVNSVMGFQLDNCSVFGLESRSTPVVRFHIGGVWFETNEDVIPHKSLFHELLAVKSPEDTDHLKKRVVTCGFNAELFPLIFDFLRRKRYCCQSVLRTVGITREQALELDRIERFVFPLDCGENPNAMSRLEGATGPRYLVDPVSGMVYVALLPSYRHVAAADGSVSLIAEKGKDVIPHDEHLDLRICSDPRFVRMVLDVRGGGKDAGDEYMLDEKMVEVLNKEYELDGERRRITMDLLKHCEIWEIERGEPFLVFAEEDEGLHYLEIITEDDQTLEWTVV